MISHSSLSETIAQLRQLSQASILTSWHYCDADLPVTQALQPDTWDRWPVATLNAKQHLAWKRGKQVRWLCQELIIPETLSGYPVSGLALRLSLLWWADQADIFVNGQLIQSGDLFDCAPRLLLSPAVQPGEPIALALRLVSPGHDDGALVRSLCLYEVPSQAVEPSSIVEPGFVADELAVLQSYLDVFEPAQIATVEAALDSIAWSHLPDRPTFDQSLAQLRQMLQPLAQGLQRRSIALLGHAHLDLAWLWPVSDTWDAAERTFKSVLALQQTFPDLTFCHSTPALYAWIETHRPELFAAIQQQVQTGRWEIVGGLWVEPELNLVHGESIARQILYGQRYTQQRFGRPDTIAWLPDTFGFCWQLPQLLKQGGIETFVTQKLRWNDTTKFPYDLFWWQAPDGTRVLAVMSAPIGEGIDPVKMAAYLWEWEQKTGIGHALWLPGVGDHGGGPTRDMLEIGDRWQHSPFFPRLHFTTAQQWLQDIRTDAVIQPQADATLPVWNQELYLEFHRGCYTTHADQKQANRNSERLLYQAELFASLATLSTGADYPKNQLETAWKQTLFNQFHDILPGSAIPPVFEEANREWAEVQATTTQILQTALEEITAQIQLPPPPQTDARPIVVFNPLNWERSAVVSRLGENRWHVLDLNGEPVLSQFQPQEQTLLFWADRIPAIGYRVFWLCPGVAPLPKPLTTFTLETDRLRVEVDAVTGDLCSLFDRQQQQEILRGLGNQLQAFQDAGQYWDAWNIDPNYAEHPLPVQSLPEIEAEQGPLQSCIRVQRQIGQSIVQQTYRLQAGSPLLQIDTQVDWQEQHTLVKAAFPVALQAEVATYEIPYGAIERPTHTTNPHEQAKWEVPALHWADLSNSEFGVSLLNTSKYGYDAQPDQLRLTLLRGATWPDPEADRGQHQFTYAIYPHLSDWRAAHTVRRGYELNQPLIVVDAIESSGQPTLPAASCLLDLKADHLVLSTLKQAEDNPQAWILRCYECHGEPDILRLESKLPLQITTAVDLLERPIDAANSSPAAWSIGPWKVASFQLSPSSARRVTISRHQ